MITKVGKTYSGVDEVPVYLLVGNVIRDAESKPVRDIDHAVVSVVGQEKSDGDTTYVSINGWRDRAADILPIRKGDVVLAVGRLKSHEYNGKTYWDMDADFVCISGGALRGIVSGAADAVLPDMPELPELTDLPDIEDDGELPF